MVTQGYADTLRTLSTASVEVRFEPFKDIDWDSPELAVIADDDRWILSSADPIGGHSWYQSLPRQRQIVIGMYRSAQLSKTGIHFEQLLISGLMFYLLGADNGDPEFRYATHEATEETNHNQMFQEFVNRVCPDAAGAPGWLTTTIPLIATVARLFPELFFLVVLAGEEPIDHLQKDVLRHEKQGHPLMRRVMQIHVAEEARHIGFAHTYLTEHVPHLDPVRKTVLGLMFPVILRLGCDAIIKPSRTAQDEMGIPDEVARELWWDRPESQKALRDLFSDVRMLADDLGLRGRVPRLIWKALGIDGRPARFRAEPASAAT
ncbi:diiron oxygenase [Nocardioides sp. KR10-350]|uniref:AurF N-oxygenase family protein n=1 Tax=Nocardioides cheoyonin TaxID=3156615 RepID=UPI0032B38385